MKKFLCTFLAITMLFVSLSVATAAAEISWSLNEDGTLTVSGTGAMENYYPATAPWYEQSNSIKAVVIGKGITSVGNNAFYGCSQLQTVTLGDQVTAIGASAFSFCTALETIVLHDRIKEIGDAAFKDCTNLRKVSIPGGVKTIKRATFQNCENLTSVSLSTVEKIDSFAFSSCVSLTAIALPSSLTSIGEYAFYHCKSLQSVAIPQNVHTIGTNAFTYCTALSSLQVNAANASFSSADNVLFNKAKTELLCYPAGKTDVSYAIPAGVKTLDAYVFTATTALQTLHIPESVTQLHDYAISNCASVANITVDEKNTTLSAVDGVLYNKEQTRIICYPPAKTDAVFTVPATVLSLGENTFTDCVQLKTVQFATDSKITSLGNAFNNCKSLQKVVLPAGLLYDEQIFTQLDTCDSLTSVSFNGESAYYTVEDGMLFEKNMNVFLGCPLGLQKKAVYLPASVTSVAAFAGRNFSTLTDIYYAGTETQWNAVSIGIDNDYIKNADVHFSHTHSMNKGNFIAANNDAIDILYSCTVCGTKEQKKCEKPAQGFLETQEFVCDAQNNLFIIHPALSLAAVLQLTAGDATILDAKENIADTNASLATGMTVVTADGTRYTVSVRGDVDCNGKIEAGDARLALRYAVGLDSPATTVGSIAADVDKDTVASAADARLILRYCVGLSDSVWSE